MQKLTSVRTSEIIACIGDEEQVILDEGTTIEEVSFGSNAPVLTASDPRKNIKSGSLIAPSGAFV